MISAKIICDSISEVGIRLTTFEIVYPRIIHSEIMTHRMLSRNAASSRAIPFAKMAEQLHGKPVRFGAANKGMQDGGSHNKPIKMSGGEGGHGYMEWEVSPEQLWESAKNSALKFAKYFHDAGYAKQVYNRLTEPFQLMKTIVSGTEWGNFYWLRDDDAADPTLEWLAKSMKEAYKASTPQLLKAGEYHLPYVDTEVTFNDETMQSEMRYIQYDSEGNGYYMSVENAIKMSCSRTAAISFRNTDYNLEKCLEVYDRLVGDEKIHGSATEHCATPMKPKHTNVGTIMSKSDWVNIPDDRSSWEKGVSHVDREGQLWSGNFRQWIQHRKLIPNENYTGEIV